MNINLDIAVYLLTNVFTCIILYQFFYLFFESKANCSKKVELILYGLYYLLITGVYFLISNPYVNLITNLVSFFLLSFYYQSTFCKRILAICMLYSLLLIIESFVVIIVGFLNISNELIISLIISKWFSVFLLAIIKRFKHLNNDYFFSKIQWFSITAFPISTIYIFITLINGSTESSLVLCLIILFSFNFIILYIYDIMNYEYNIILKSSLKINQKEYENKIFLREKTAYYNQIELLKRTQSNLEMLSHDYKNHYLSLRKLMEMGNINAALSYIEKLSPEQTFKHIYANTGNISIDSILNYKFEYAISNNIIIDFKLAIPNDLIIDCFDISVILGNLLDNAIEACLKCEVIKKMKFFLVYDKGVVHLSISNTFDGYFVKEGGNYLTTKDDKAVHGIGLKSVKSVVEKYNGVMETLIQQDKFVVNLILYV